MLFFMRCMDTTKLDLERKALKDRIRPRVRAQLLNLANEDGLLMSPIPEDLMRKARKLRLVKGFMIEGKPSPSGYRAWWFVRLHDGKKYTPPNFSKYKDFDSDLDTPPCVAERDETQYEQL